ncbi:Dehydrogenase/reductase SDR family member 13 [Phytophthora nicotianae]|uniref:Dehydrogenase/reductase SDR family member 13 n=1 Tax=Phytophthora nicotianae TaxID=4792 RepID=A0A0W8CUH5_PHYNI|nr:Dehydrogenase/reductase SDR family member 13 [Phytophthora nicotianae]
MQLAKLEAKIRQESSQSGRSLPEDQLASYLMGQFEEAMKAIESQVYAKFQTTEDEVKVATEYFEEEDDKDVANAVAKLQELYRVMTGGGFSDVEVPSELTLTKFIEIMQETMESLNVAMEEVCLEVKELNPDNKEEAINQRYVKRADNLSAEIHAKHGLTREVLQAAMMKYQQEPAFLMAMTELQQQQAERFAAAAAIFNGDHVDRTKVLHNMMKKTLHDDEQSPLFLWGLPREHILEFIRQSVLPSSWIHPSRRPVSEWEAVTNEEDEVAQVRRAVSKPGHFTVESKINADHSKIRRKKIRENKERAKSPRSPDEHELKKKQAAERMERTHRHREQIIQLEDEKLAAKREAYLRKVNPDRQLPASELEQTPRYRRRKAWLHVVSFAAISHHWHQELVQTKNLMAMAKVEGVAACIIQKIWRKWKWQHASKHTVVVYTWLRKCLWKLLLRVRCRRKARNAALLRLFMQDQYSQSHAKKNFTRVMIQWRGKVIRAQKAGMRLTARKDSSSGSAPGSAGAHRSRAGSVAILGGMDEKLANMQMLITPVELQRLQQTSAQVVKIPKREVKLEEARAIVQGSLNWEEATDNRGNAITSSTSKAAHPSPCFVLFSNPNGAKTMEYLVRRGIQLTLDADPELRALVARQQEHRLSSSRRPSVSFNGVSAGSPSPRRYSILKKPTQTLLMPLPPSVLAINSDTNTTTPDSPSHSKAF